MNYQQRLRLARLRGIDGASVEEDALAGTAAEDKLRVAGASGPNGMVLVVPLVRRAAASGGFAALRCQGQENQLLSHEQSHNWNRHGQVHVLHQIPCNLPCRCGTEGGLREPPQVGQQIRTVDCATAAAWMNSADGPGSGAATVGLGVEAITPCHWGAPRRTKQRGTTKTRPC